MIDTRKHFQLQTGVFLKRPDVATFDETYKKIFGDCVVDLLWCCHNETQTRNEARNCFSMVVLSVQMCMHFFENRECI